MVPRQRRGRAQGRPDRGAVPLHDAQEGHRAVQAPAVGPRDQGRDPRLAGRQDGVPVRPAQGARHRSTWWRSTSSPSRSPGRSPRPSRLRSPADMAAGPGGVFAAGGAEPLPVTIRLETPGDEPGVRRVHEAAFPGPEEADIVDAIRRARARLAGSRSSRVDRAGEIVGHVLLSPCPVEDDDGRAGGRGPGAGPDRRRCPQLQFRGVGSALMTAAVSLAMARGVPGHRAARPPCLLPALRLRGGARVRPRAAGAGLAGRRVDGPPPARLDGRPAAAPSATRRRSSPSPDGRCRSRASARPGCRDTTRGPMLAVDVPHRGPHYPRKPARRGPQANPRVTVSMVSRAPRPRGAWRRVVARGRFAPRLTRRRRTTPICARWASSRSCKRTLGFLSNFAVAFSYISVSTGTFTLMGLGLGGRRAGLLLVVADRRRRPAVRRAELRRARQPLPGGRLDLPVVEAPVEQDARLVHRLDLLLGRAS